MNQSLLTCLRLPARLDLKQAAEVLGFLEHELSVLMKVGLLKPLGRPAPNGHKYFGSAEILELSQNREWLDKATRSVAKCWHEKNRRSKEEKEPVA